MPKANTPNQERFTTIGNKAGQRRKKYQHNKLVTNRLIPTNATTGEAPTLGTVSCNNPFTNLTIIQSNVIILLSKHFI